MTIVLDKSSLGRFENKRNKGDCRLESMAERVRRTTRGFNSRPRDGSPSLAVAQVEPLTTTSSPPLSKLTD
jgi:hypothetical protein